MVGGAQGGRPVRLARTAGRRARRAPLRRAYLEDDPAGGVRRRQLPEARRRCGGGTPRTASGGQAGVVAERRLTSAAAARHLVDEGLGGDLCPRARTAA